MVVLRREVVTETADFRLVRDLISQRRASNGRRSVRRLRGLLRGTPSELVVLEESGPLAWIPRLAVGRLGGSDVEVDGRAAACRHDPGREREGRLQREGSRPRCPDLEGRCLRQVRLVPAALQHCFVPHHDCWPL